MKRREDEIVIFVVANILSMNSALKFIININFLSKQIVDNLSR